MDLIVDAPRDAGAETNAAFAYRVLRDNLMRLRLEPGQILNEPALAGELGVSRTPVREALFRLKEENLVEIVPHKASMVSRISFLLVQEGRFARAATEPRVAGLIAGRLDKEAVGRFEDALAAQAELADDGGPEAQARFFALDARFHALLYEACGLEEIGESVAAIATHYDRMRYFQVLSGELDMHAAHQGHRRLLKAVREGDAESAASLARDHLIAPQLILPYAVEHHSHYFLDFDL